MSMTRHNDRYPAWLSLRFFESEGRVRVEFIDRDTGRVRASFDDFKSARQWLRQHRYGYTPVGGGMWVLESE